MSKRRSNVDDNWWKYPPNQPIEPIQGIKAQSQRGKFVANWWANRWIAALKRLYPAETGSVTMLGLANVLQALFLCLVTHVC